jgi:hypothetical protein
LVICVSILQTDLIAISKTFIRAILISLLLLLFVFVSNYFLSKTSLYLKVFQFIILTSVLIRNIYSQKNKLN